MRARAHRRPRGHALPCRRGRPVGGVGPCRGSSTRPARHRLDPDPREPRHRRRRRGRHPGSRRDGRPRAGRQGAPPADAAGRSRHQGRLDRWTARARAHRRCRAAVRGRAQHPAAHAARGQEPIRSGRRDRLLRPVRRRDRRGRRSDRALRLSAYRAHVRHLRHRHPRGTPAAARRGSGPRHPQPMSSPRRAVSGLDSSAARDAAGRARPTGRPPPCTPATSTPRRSAARHCEGRLPTWPSPSPWPARSPTSPSASGTVAIGEVGLAGELRQVPTSASGSPRPLGSVSRHAVVPDHRHTATATLPAIDGLTVVECADLHETSGARRHAPAPSSARPGSQRPAC